MPNSNEIKEPKKAAQKRPARTEVIKQERRRRKSFDGLNQRLYYPEELKDPNYSYRWINDSGNRLSQMTQNDDWEIVESETTGDNELDSGIGTKIERLSGTSTGGQPQKTFLCRKPKEYYLADKQAQQDSISETEQGIIKGPAPSAEGLSGQNSYVPGVNKIDAPKKEYKP